MEERIRIYLEDAKRFVEEAAVEFAEGVKAGDSVKIRDAAEKAWNAVVQASNALILKYAGKTPASHWERRRLLRELERAYPELEKMGLRDRYSARERNLHELVFYEGVVDVEDVKVEIEKARKYVEDVELLLRETAGGNSQRR
ncbi:MAG: PaREP1 family protein [Pyrobaculum sp.]